MSPQLATRPCAHIAWRLGGEDTYPCARAGVAANTVITAVNSAVTTIMTVLLMVTLLTGGLTAT